MTKTENLIANYEGEITFKQTRFRSKKICGLCVGDFIFYDENLSLTEKNCILAEEIGHYKTGVGNIIKCDTIDARKQEARARKWAYKKLISIDDLIRCFDLLCQNKFEIAEELEITEEFLEDALKYFKSKYGLSVKKGDYTVFFNPLSVVKNLKADSKEEV